MKKVYLFGSYGRGEAKMESDVDLEERLEKKIDIVENDFIYEKLRPNIDKSKVLLLEK